MLFLLPLAELVSAQRRLDGLSTTTSTTEWNGWVNAWGLPDWEGEHVINLSIDQPGGVTSLAEAKIQCEAHPECTALSHHPGNVWFFLKNFQNTHSSWRTETGGYSFHWIQERVPNSHNIVGNPVTYSDSDWESVGVTSPSQPAFLSIVVALIALLLPVWQCAVDRMQCAPLDSSWEIVCTHRPRGLLVGVGSDTVSLFHLFCLLPQARTAPKPDCHNPPLWFRLQ